MLKITHIKQLNNAYCAPAVAGMILDFWGIHKSQTSLAKLCNTTRARGTDRKNLIACFKKFDLKIEQNIHGNWNILNEFVNKKKIPVIVGWFFEDWGHYSIVLKLTKKSIWLTDSFEGKVFQMDWKKFDQLWFGFDEKFPKEKNIIPNWYLAVFR